MATLEGKKIVVIGGTSGIGYAVAKGALLSLAEHVFVASSSPDRVKAAVSRLGAEPALQKLQPELPKRVTGDVVDMANTKAIQEYLTKVGEIDHLVITSGRFTGMIDFKNADLKDSRCTWLHTRIRRLSCSFLVCNQLSSTIASGASRPLRRA